MTSETPSRPDPLDQPADRQVLRADALERREQPAQHEVAASHRPRSLDGHQVVHPGDHAENLRVAPGVAADVAHRLAFADLRDVPAAPARAELVAQRRQLFAELTGERVVGRQEPQHVALRGLLPDAREA